MYHGPLSLVGIKPSLRKKKEKEEEEVEEEDYPIIMLIYGFTND